MFEHLPLRAGAKVRLVIVRDRQQPGRRPGVANVPLQVRTSDPRVGKVVVQTARLLQQLAHGDAVAAAQHARRDLLDRVVELQLPLADELEHDRRHERLRHAADPEPVARPGADTAVYDRVSARQPDRPVPVAHQQHRAGHPGGDDPVERLLQRRLAGGRRRRRLRDDTQEENRTDRGGCRNPHLGPPSSRRRRLPRSYPCTSRSVVKAAPQNPRQDLSD